MESKTKIKTKTKFLDDVDTKGKDFGKWIVVFSYGFFFANDTCFLFVEEVTAWTMLVAALTAVCFIKMHIFDIKRYRASINSVGSRTKHDRFLRICFFLSLPIGLDPNLICGKIHLKRFTFSFGFLWIFHH